MKPDTVKRNYAQMIFLLKKFFLLIKMQPAILLVDDHIK